MDNIKVAIVGVGNVASALVQGVEYYKDARADVESIGLSHPDFAGYHVSDIEFVAAFDVADTKVGTDLSEAIFAKPNNVMKFADVGKTGVQVVKGPLLDGVDDILKALVKVSSAKDADVVKVLKDSGAEVLVNLLPGSAEEATKYYAQAALDADCAFINGVPIPIASDLEWAKKFEEKGLPLIGDDIQDQLGSTVLHRNILQLLVSRGVQVDKSYQLDVGGGAESLDSHYRGRMRKRGVKSEAISQDLPYDAPLVAGSSDYVSFMDNSRDSYFYINGRQFGGAPVKIDIRMEITDGPNAGPILLDAIRGAKLAMKRGLKGPMEAISAYGFKMPPTPTTVYRAERWVEEFLLGKRKT
ncbi:MAG: inositol-3-phosphate synthase [Candidatus Thorarchaeota archaeon]|nr:MAG: inositol-3-phosphate synthase [Candidatus Thorarchaeota archaeon]RLI59523.1 MAG: inositol-3-phosphate synthase [Candidatus Thorarchaeota archaeon]